ILGSAGSVLTANIWYHIAVDKDAGGKIRLYRNGVMVASVTPTDSSMALINQNLHIGCVSGNNGLNGYLDEIRITKGVCRYGADGGFVVPTRAYPRTRIETPPLLYG